ncbi:MAG: protein kinase [Lysobacterales bacterium]
MIQIPGYLIKREIGIGGMAKVYLAVQTSLEREVALKVMNPAMVSDPSFSRRFTQEARTLASLAHPNIVAVYDVGITEEKLHYFSMQHLPNGDFLKRIRNGVPEAEVVRVLSGVARALGFAHQRGIVHRDVAPGNVLFDPNDNPVLTDFGIARAVTKTSRITNAGVSVGTSHYMSPEQARGSDVDGRSDVYSLGALAFEALTGNPPYDGEDGFAIAYAHVFEPVPTLPEHRRHWQPLIDRAMAKDPAERFQGTEEFLAALTRITALAEPTHASKPARAPDAPTVPMPALPKLFASAAAMASNLVNRKPNAAPEADADAPAPAARVPAATGPTHPDTAQPKPPVAPPRPVRAESVPTADAPTRPAPLPVLTTAESGPAGESATLRTAAAAAHSPSAPAAPSTGSARPMPPTPVIAATEKPPSTAALHDQVTPIVNRIPVTESETPSVNYTPHRTAPDNAATAQATTRSAPLPAPAARHDAPTPTPPSRRREPPVDPARTRAAPSGTPRPRWQMPAAIAALVAALVIGALVWSGKSDSPGTLPAVATDPGTTQSSSSAPDPLAADGTDLLESTGTDQTGLNLDDSAWLVPADPSLQSEADRAYYQVAVATTVIDPVATLLRLARADLAAQRLTQPPGRNAGERYALALKIEPKNAEAKAGLLETGRAYAKMAATALAAGQLAEWQDYSERAIAVAGEFDSAGELRQNYQDQRNQLLNAALDEGRSALARWDEAAATSAFQRALALTPGQAEASAGIKSARGIGKPGYVFSDVIGKGKGPELIIKQIAGKRLAVARTEVTVDQFRQFWAAGGATSRAQRPSCRDRESGFRSSRSRTWQSPGFAQTGAHPVVCVDWEDAQAYAAWLGKASGQRYRLASAAEWEALASQGGKLEDCGANIGDRQFNARYRDRSALACDDGAAETAAVRRFAATGGVFDLVGNVREWVSDCAGNCRKHLAMGSSWASVAGELEVAQREDFDADTGYNTVGLRVVREID